LLPTTFSPGPHFKPCPIEDEVYNFIQEFNPEAPPDGVAESDARRLFYYMPRVVFSTSWKKAEDVVIDELAELHKAQRIFISGKSDSRFITSAVPWTLFLVELKKAFPD